MQEARYSYGKLIETSERVGWSIDDVLGDSGFDFTRPFLPETLAQVQGLTCLSDQEKLRLNQLRGLTYAHLFGFVEEFIVQKVLELASRYPGDQSLERRALLRFAEEEVKHQILFERAKSAAQEELGECGLIPGAGDVAGVVLQKSELCVLLLMDMLELTTQHHYTEIFRSSEERESLDPAFVQIFKSHWIEEAQHTKLGYLEIERVARDLSEEERETAVDELLEIGGAFDGLLSKQAELDLDSLARLADRSFSAEEREQIFTQQHRAYRYTFLVLALRHEKFKEIVGSLTKDGLAKIEQAASALSA